MDAMIDLHCHILTNRDDGPDTLEESVAMCRAAAAEGVKTIVAAPHYKTGIYEFSSREIQGDIDTLRQAVFENGIILEILSGAEIGVTPELPAILRNDDSLTINRNGRYFLAEFPPLTVPTDWDRFLLSFLLAGMTPIIAHPERNAWFVNHIDALENAVRTGVLVQLTARSITGGFGRATQNFCVDLLRRNLVHVIASDGHSADFRPPNLVEALKVAAQVVGPQRAKAMVTVIPQAIIEGRSIPLFEPNEDYPNYTNHKINWLQRLQSLFPMQYL